MSSLSSSIPFDPSNVNLQTVNAKDVTCYFTQLSRDLYDASDVNQTTRITSIFVIWIASTSAATIVPWCLLRYPRLRISRYLFLMVRYFGTGVMIATAFIHLLDPAYSEIGPQTCVGQTGAWANYSWPPAIAMMSAMTMFLLDFIIDSHVRNKLGIHNKNIIDAYGDVEAMVTTNHTTAIITSATNTIAEAMPPTLQLQHDKKGCTDQNNRGNRPSSPGKNCTVTSATTICAYINPVVTHNTTSKHGQNHDVVLLSNLTLFEERLSAFLMIEFAVILRSTLIGLNLGVSGTEFRTLYPVVVFHQCFEGLAIGARISTITFPSQYLRWRLPSLLCGAFGLATPLAVGIGVMVRSWYSPFSFTDDVVTGILDSISAGIFLYTGFVEWLARDFLLHPERLQDRYRVIFMVLCLYFGIAIMGVLGKWS